MPWLLLSVAIVTEVIGTMALKMSNGLTVLVPSLVVAAGYGTSFWILAIVLKSLDVGTAYAVWSGAGTALVAIIGMVLFKEPMSAMKAVCIGLIVLGVVGLHMAEGKAA